MDTNSIKDEEVPENGQSKSQQYAAIGGSKLCFGQDMGGSGRRGNVAVEASVNANHEIEDVQVDFHE